MTSASPGARAVAAFELEDVFVIAEQSALDRDYNPTQPMPEVAFQHRLLLQTQFLSQKRIPTDAPDESIQIVRYYAIGDLRLLKNPTASEESAAAEQDAICTLSVTFAADYRSSLADLTDKAAMAAFGKNVLFHVWPFWRERVSELASRMRLPRLMIPMRRPDAPTSVVPYVETLAGPSQP